MVFVKHAEELKARALMLLATGAIPKDVAEIFGVSERSLARWKRTNYVYGTVNVPLRGQRGRPRTFTNEQVTQLRGYLSEHPDSLLLELVEWCELALQIAVPFSTLHRTMRDAGLTYKVLRRAAAERDERERILFTDKQQSELHARLCIWVDESSKDDRTIYRRYGWARRGERAVLRVPQEHGTRYSILPAMTLDGYVTMRVVEGSIDSHDFLDFILNDVLPLTNPWPEDRSVIVLDNCPTHKYDVIRACVESEGRRLQFLPTYSPDKNPIEESFSCFKAHLRHHYRDFLTSETPEQDLRDAAVVITPEKARAWAQNSGYPVDCDANCECRHFV